LPARDHIWRHRKGFPICRGASRSRYWVAYAIPSFAFAVSAPASRLSLIRSRGIRIAQSEKMEGSRARSLKSYMLVLGTGSD
jgi:hypothetical protein